MIFLNLMDQRIPVLFAIDVEPDEHVFSPDDPSPWRGLELLFNFMGSLRRRVSEVTGEPARFLWSLRLDPQISESYGSPTWVLDSYPALVAEMVRHGDGIGVHPHGQRWDGRRGIWVFDHANQPWVNHCVTTAFEAYESHFGHPPDYHRFGSMFLSTETVFLAERLGARFDMTPEPGEPPAEPGWRSGGEWTGFTPDYGPVPQFPYHPSPDDFRQPVAAPEDRLWIIPLSSGERTLRRWKGRLQHPARTLRRVARRFQHVSPPPDPVGAPRRAHRTLRMWVEWKNPATFWRSATELLARLERPYLAFAVRSDLPIRSAEMRNFRAIMEHLLKHSLAGRLVFTTPEDALGRMGLTG